MSSSEFAPKLTCEAFSGAMRTGHLVPQDRTSVRSKATILPNSVSQCVELGFLAGRSIGVYSTKVLFSLPTAPLNSSHTLQGIFQPLPQQLLTACMASERVGAYGAYYCYAGNQGLNLLKSSTGNYSCCILEDSSRTQPL